MKKILIFYSKTGGGHFRAAQAIEEQLIKNGCDVVLCDGLVETDFGIKTDPGAGYSLLSTKLIHLFNALYILTNNQLGVAVIKRLIRLVWGKQLTKIIIKEKPDLILTTHHFITKSSLSQPPVCPFVIMVTDLGKAHRIWFDSRSEYIITPTEQMADYAKNKLIILPEKVVNLGYPIKPGFELKTISSDLKNTLLVLGGGVGSGNIKQIVLTLLNKFPEHKIEVVCGFNKQLYGEFSQQKTPHLKVYEFVDNLAALIKNSDMVITKAGPATIVEATLLHKPLIITSWVGMQEEENVTFVLENHLGNYTPKLKKLAESVALIYQNYSRFRPKQQIFVNGSGEIANFLETLNN